MQSPILRARAGVAGHYPDPARMRLADPAGFDAKVDERRRARLAYEAGSEVLTIPAAATGHAAMNFAGSAARQMSSRAAFR